MFLQALVSAAPAVSIGVELVEPYVFIRRAPQWSAENDQQQRQARAGGSQLRGVITLSVQKPNVHASALQVDLVGTTTSSRPHKGSYKEVREETSRQTITLDLPGSSTEASVSKALAVGQQAIPFTLAVPSDLPPSTDVEFGNVSYVVRVCLLNGTNDRVCTLKEPEDVLVVMDAAWNASLNAAIEPTSDMLSDDPPVRTQTRRSDWMDALHIEWSTLSDWADMGSSVATKLHVMPMDENKPVHIHSVTLRLNESIKATTSDDDRRLVKRTSRLVHVARSRLSRTPMLPFVDDSTLPEDNQRTLHELQDAAVLAHELIPAQDKATYEQRCGDDCAKKKGEAAKSIKSQNGPWSLAWNVQLPHCGKGRLSETVQHPRCPISVTHALQLDLDVEVDIVGQKTRKTIIFVLPFIVRSMFYAHTYAQLPCYYCAAGINHPWEPSEIRTDGGLVAFEEGQEPQSSPSSVVSPLTAEELSLSSCDSEGQSSSCASSPPSRFALPTVSLATFGKWSGLGKTSTPDSILSPPSKIDSLSVSSASSTSPSLPPPYKDSVEQDNDSDISAEDLRVIDQCYQSRQRVASQWLSLTTLHRSGLAH